MRCCCGLWVYGVREEFAAYATTAALVRCFTCFLKNGFKINFMEDDTVAW